MHAMCIFELHVTDNDIKISSVAQQYFYSELFSPVTTIGTWSSCGDTTMVSYNIVV